MHSRIWVTQKIPIKECPKTKIGKTRVSPIGIDRIVQNLIVGFNKPTNIITQQTALISTRYTV